MAEEKMEKKPKNISMEINVLFLDVDGVLNTGIDEGLSESMIKRLSVIINETNCKLCLSSSWRLNQFTKEYLLKMLKEIGHINIDDAYIGQTPRIYDKPRAFEIEKFIKNTHYKINKWCALDDMSLNKPLHESRELILKQCEIIMNNHFVQTDDKIGLTDTNVKQTIAFLK
eukprot:221609_1